MENNRNSTGYFTAEYVTESLRADLAGSYRAMFFDPEANNAGMGILTELTHDFSALEQDINYPQNRQYENATEASIFA